MAVTPSDAIIVAAIGAGGLVSVAWINASFARKLKASNDSAVKQVTTEVLPKIQEVHVLVNSRAEAQDKRLDAQSLKIEELLKINAALTKSGELHELKMALQEAISALKGGGPALSSPAARTPAEHLPDSPAGLTPPSSPAHPQVNDG